VLNYESLKPEEKEALAKMNPEIAKWLAEEEAEREKLFEDIWTLEKYLARVQEIKEEMRAKLNYTIEDRRFFQR